MSSATFDNTSSVAAEVLEKYGDEEEMGCILYVEQLAPAEFPQSRKQKLMCILVEQLGMSHYFFVTSKMPSQQKCKCR